MPYGYIASMKTQPGKRDDVVAILLSGLDGLKAAGASQYTVAVRRRRDDLGQIDREGDADADRRVHRGRDRRVRGYMS